MDLRSTVGTRVANAVSNLQSQAASTAHWQQQIASGKKLVKPSDAPSDFVQMIDYKSRSLRFDTHLTAIANSTTTLNDSVNQLQDAQNVLTKAQLLATDGANAPTDDQAYEAIATEVDALLDQMFGLANSKSGGRYLYGGAATTTPPFQITARDSAGNPTAISYSGSDDPSRGIIGAGQNVDTNYAGNRIFQQPGADVFQSLMSLRDNLRDTSMDQPTKSSAINQRLQEITTARAQLLTTMGQQSSSLENLDALKTRVEDAQVNVAGRVGELEGTDFAQAAVKFQEQMNSLQATLAVTAKIFDSSMLSFMN